MSWYGQPAGHGAAREAFHFPPADLSSRSRSAWYRGPAARAGSHRDRLATALDLLRDPAYDSLITGESRFERMPETMARLAAAGAGVLTHRITHTPPPRRASDPCSA